MKKQSQKKKSDKIVIENFLNEIHNSVNKYYTTFFNWISFLISWFALNETGIK